MATPVNDTYTVPAGQPINAGRSVSVAAPDATGGALAQLLAGWSGTGSTPHDASRATDLRCLDTLAVPDEASTAPVGSRRGNPR